jgi:xanthine dehydrogenase YagS FAD-binding subunit
MRYWVEASLASPFTPATGPLRSLLSMPRSTCSVQGASAPLPSRSFTASQTTLQPGELILRIRVPVTSMGFKSTYHKIRDRESYAFALASAAVALDMDGDVVRAARIALGGLATRPWRARKAEQLLAGRRLTTEAARAAGDAALEGATRGHDNGFRIELGARTVADALMIASQRGQP